MKKLLIILLIVLGLNSCTEDKSKTYTLKYVVFYPGYSDTQTVFNHTGYYWETTRDGNYINEIFLGSGNGPTVYHNTAPFKILFYTVKENK